MRKYLLAAAAAAAITSPAVARDRAGYVGVDLGAMLVEDVKIDVTNSAGNRFDDYANGDHDYGYDVGVNAGYDFGAVRAEAEVAYKRARHSEYVINGAIVGADGRTTSLSVMGNLLLDFGADDSWQGFVGGGAGYARTRVDLAAPGFSSRRLSDNGFAWQVLAGVRYPVSDNIDFGIKYRLFNHEIEDGITFAPLSTVAGTGKARVRTHSLMASLTFNLGAPPVVVPVAEPAPPPPPPPPPPPTQTCPDGSVILASDACPVPPPPPPPPEVAPVRG